MSTQEAVTERQSEPADDRPPIRTDGGREASKLECDDDMFCRECGIMLTYYAAIVHGYDYCPECTIERVEKELFAVFGTLNSVEASHKFDVPETEQRLVTDGGVSVADLTAFQHNVLLVLADKPRYGLAIKRELQRYYGEEVNHGRLYPNLDQLVEKGLVQKKELDKRTNLYELTDAAIHTLRARQDWVDERLEASVVEQLGEVRSERDVRTDGGRNAKRSEKCAACGNEDENIGFSDKRMEYVCTSCVEFLATHGHYPDEEPPEVETDEDSR